MPVESARLIEALRANLTLERPLACVNSKMNLETQGCREFLGADRTAERSLRFVSNVRPWSLLPGL